MLQCSVSWAPLVTIAVANFFLSWLYYSPAAPWFKIWQKAVGMDPNKKEMTAEEKKKFPFIMGGAVLGTFLLSYGLQVIVHNVGAKTFLSGAVVGIVIWAGFALTQSLNLLFEGRKTSLLVLSNILYIFTYGVFGGVVAIWR